MSKMPRKRSGGTKECLVCQEKFESYRKNNTYCSGYCRWRARHLTQTQEEKQKRAERTARWGQDNKDKRRNYNLQYTFGITLEKYKELLAKQNGCCAVCKRHYDTFPKALAVDHDHKTGEIFGLLCTYCNRNVIGRIRNPELFKAAYEYLVQGTGLFVPKKKKKRRKKRKRK